LKNQIILDESFDFDNIDSNMIIQDDNDEMLAAGES